MTALALALTAGVALRLTGVPAAAAPLTGLLLTLPVWPWIRPADRAPVVAGFFVLALAGWLHAAAALDRRARDCRWTLPEGPGEMVGFVTTVDAPGRPRVRAVEGLPGGCRATLRVVVRGGRSGPAGEIAPGTRVRLTGQWSATWRGPADERAAADPVRAGVFLAEHVEPWSEGGPPPLAERMRRAAAGVRARVDDALERRLGEVAPLARALVVARRDGLDAEVRDAFARSGTAHLLAISGFHVGVVALLAMTVARALSASRRRAAGLGAAVALAYAALLGFPDAATRAAILVALVAAGRALGRPVLSVGALSTALLVLLIADPTGLGRIGFQLSFAGAFGLAILARPCERAMERWAGAWVARARGRGRGPRWLSARGGRLGAAVVDGVAASSAATLATLPLVAWHFESVPLLGVLTTLVVGPLVSAALPGLIVVVLLDLTGLPGAGVAAFGSGAFLQLSEGLVTVFAAVPGAALGVTRPQVVAGLAGAGVATLAITGTGGLGRATRGAVAGAGAAVALALLPLTDGALRSGTFELHVLDVGQGDAVVVRTPRGRWVLVDTGPDPGDRLVRRLRALGVRRLALMVLTHPHLDHIGGAAEVLDALPVGAVGDPGLALGSEPYREVLGEARRAGVPWRTLVRGDTLRVDGVEFAVLWPAEPPSGPVAGVDPNDLSVVVRVAWGGFSALLTGDAPAEAEARFGPEAGPVTLLKLGHHGSTTSTAPAFLDAIRPELAVVSAGRFNRFGHPAPAVLERVVGAGIPLHRTDRDGAARYRVRRDGTVEVRRVD